MGHKKSPAETELGVPESAEVFRDSTGDVAGDGRSTTDLQNRRVLDPDAPLDYPTLDDGSTRVGNVYPD